MKRLLSACSLLGLLTVAASCQKNDDQPGPASTTCPGAGDVVKTVTDVRGIVRRNSVTQEYAISTYPTVTNSFTVGVLCASLPANLQVDGAKVIFSGTYRLKPGAPTGGDVAEFYLIPSKVDLDPNP